MPFSPCDEIALKAKFSPVAALPYLMLQAVLLTAVFLYSIWRAFLKHIPSANAPPLVDLTVRSLWRNLDGSYTTV